MVSEEIGKTILTVDIGNTAVKAALFRDGHPVRSVVGREVGFKDVAGLFGSADVQGICCCCVGCDREGIADKLEDLGVPVLRLTSETPLPIEVDYDRSTLGVDRVAAAVGVSTPDTPVLIVDAGTAVTLDLVAGGRFLGGNISPGLRLRFRSLNAFTSRLPLVSPEGKVAGFGHDTRTAIRSGVVNGLIAEITSAYNSVKNGYENLKLVLTGGDASLIGPMLEECGIPFAADSEAVGRGLVRIYNYNNNL